MNAGLVYTAATEEWLILPEESVAGELQRIWHIPDLDNTICLERC